MITVKNVGKSPRGFHDAKGRHVLIHPGKSQPVNLNTAGVKLLERNPNFEITGAVENSAPSDELAIVAESLGITIGKGWGVRKIQAEIKKAQEEIALAEVLEEAEALGVRVRPRWTIERIKTEVEKARTNAVHDPDSE